MLVVKIGRNYNDYFYLHITCFHVRNFEIFSPKTPPDFTLITLKEFSREENLFEDCPGLVLYPRFEKGDVL